MFKHLFKNLIAGNWKAVGWAALSALGSLLLAIISVIPLAPLGDRKGHVGSNEKPWAVQGQWLSAIAWVSFLPAIVWYLASNTNPYLLWLELPIAIAGSFWLSRRFSAHQGEEQTVRQWLSGLGNLIGDPPRGRFDADEEPPALPFNGWRALSLVGAGVMAVAVLLILLPHWVFLLPYGQSLVSQISEYNAGILLLGYWISVLPSAAAGYKHGKLQSSQANIRLVWEPQLQVVLGVTRQIWDENQCQIIWAEDKRELTISPIPAAARLKLSGIESRVEEILPGWLMFSASSEKVVLRTVDQDADTGAARSLRNQSGNMIVAIAHEADGRQTWTLNPNQTADAYALNVFAQNLPRPLMLLAFDAHALKAVAGVLPTPVRRVRDRLAELQGAKPWDVEIEMDGPTSETPSVTGLRIIRAPAVSRDAGKRHAFFQDFVTAQFGTPTGHLWKFAERASDGRIEIRCIPDPLFDVVPYSGDPTAVSDPTTPWVVGMDEEGQKVEINLADSAHMLIAGATRSGKSVCTYSLLTHVLTMGDRVRLLVADPNDTTIAPFEHLVSWSTSETHPTPVTEMLQWVRREMDRRKPILREMKTDKVSIFTAELPMLVICIDEAANYMRHSDANAAKELITELLAVASQGAKYGVRLVLITQRPDSTILPTPIRSQLSARISFRLEDKETATMTFPDIDDPTELLSFAPGVGLIKEVAGRPRRFRSEYLHDHWAAAEQIQNPLVKIDVAERAGAARKAGFVMEPEPEVRVIGEFEFSLEDLDSGSDVNSSGQESAPAELKPAPAVQGGFVL
jgi:hypothetical protein